MIKERSRSTIEFQSGPISRHKSSLKWQTTTALDTQKTKKIIRGTTPFHQLRIWLYVCTYVGRYVGRYVWFNGFSHLCFSKTEPWTCSMGTISSESAICETEKNWATTWAYGPRHVGKCPGIFDANNTCKGDDVSLFFSQFRFLSIQIWCCF